MTVTRVHDIVYSENGAVHSSRECCKLTRKKLATLIRSIVRHTVACSNRVHHTVACSNRVHVV